MLSWLESQGSQLILLDEAMPAGFDYSKCLAVGMVEGRSLVWAKLFKKLC